MTELNPPYSGIGVAVPAPFSSESPANSTDNRPSYNKTLTSGRCSSLDQINTKNIGKLTVLCTRGRRPSRL